MKFLASSVALALALAALGYFPTVRLGGRGALTGMVSGILVSLVGSWIGAIPIALIRRRTDEAGRANREASVNVLAAVMGSTLLRLAVVASLSVTIVLAGWVELGSLLVWVGISYLVFLVPDTLYAVASGRAAQSPRT